MEITLKSSCIYTVFVPVFATAILEGRSAIRYDIQRNVRR